MLKSSEGFSLFVKIADKGKTFVQSAQHCCLLHCKHYRVFTAGNSNFVLYIISNIGAFNFCDFTLCNFFIVDFIKNNIIYNFYVINGDYAKISSPQKIRRYSIYQALLQFVFVSDFSYQCAGGRLLLWFCSTFDRLDQESQTHARWFVLLNLVLSILFCKSVKLAILSFLYILAFMNK